VIQSMFDPLEYQGCIYSLLFYSTLLIQCDSAYLAIIF
jgi:hypothetical protein